MKEEQINIGILGASGFSRFSAGAFLEVPNINISDVLDSKPQNPKSFAKQFDCKVLKTQKELLEGIANELAIKL